MDKYIAEELFKKGYISKEDYDNGNYSQECWDYILNEEFHNKRIKKGDNCVENYDKGIPVEEVASCKTEYEALKLEASDLHFGQSSEAYKARREYLKEKIQ